VPGGNIFPHHLLNLKGLQLFNEPRPDEKTDEKSGQNRIDRPEGDIPKDIEKGVNRMKRIEEMVEHPVKPSS
jgi:hypothetical protein